MPESDRLVFGRIAFLDFDRGLQFGILSPPSVCVHDKPSGFRSELKARNRSKCFLDAPGANHDLP